MLWVIVLLLLLGGGFYGYHKLKEIERQIRDEQAREKEETQQEKQQSAEQDISSSEDSNVSASKNVGASIAKPETKAAEQPDVSAVSDAEATILKSIQNQPGIVQSDLYPQFPEMNKKQLQELIKRMADDKKLKRQPYRSSYQLYPA